MDDKRKTVMAVIVIIAFMAIIIISLAALLSRKNTLSPVPDEPAIRIIFITPTPVITISITPAPTR